MSRCHCQLTEQEGGPPNERWLFMPWKCKRCGRVEYPDHWDQARRDTWEADA